MAELSSNLEEAQWIQYLILFPRNISPSSYSWKCKQRKQCYCCILSVGLPWDLRRNQCVGFFQLLIYITNCGGGGYNSSNVYNRRWAVMIHKVYCRYKRDKISNSRPHLADGDKLVYGITTM